MDRVRRHRHGDSGWAQLLRGPDRAGSGQLLHPHGRGLPSGRRHRLGLDHVGLGDPLGVYRPRSARWRKLGAVDVNRVGEHQRVWPTRLPRQHERPALGADHAHVEHHRSLRTDRPLGRERPAVRLESP